MDYTVEKLKENTFSVSFADNQQVTFVCSIAQLASNIALYIQDQHAPRELPITYSIMRYRAYPPFADQLDLMYHGGYDAWKDAIKAIKDTYPKG